MLRRRSARTFLALFAFALLLAPTLPGQELTLAPKSAPAKITKPFLWRIEGAKPSWLFGTIHLPDPRVLDTAESVDDALAAADALFTEIDMTDPGAMLGAVKHMMLERGTTLEDVIGPELHARLAAYVEKKGGRMRTFRRQKPWAAGMNLIMLDERLKKMTMAGHLPLDLHLATEAKKRGQHTGGLETIEEQIGIFEALSLDDQKAFLEGTIGSLEEAETDPLETMIGLYLKGDADALMELTSDYKDDVGEELSKHLMHELLDVRNLRMADRIVKRLQEHPDQSAFFAVGTAHLPGDVGLVNLLRQRGYIVTRMPGDRGMELEAARKASRAAYRTALQKQLQKLDDAPLVPSR